MTGFVETEKRHQVFVSSTYLDLVDERRAIIQALLELDCIPAGMEMFPAADDDQWTLIKEVIDLSDYYIVVVGGRYGSVTAEGMSYTEMEYDYAVASGIPVLGFVHADPGSIPQNMSELDEEPRKKLEAFREKVLQRMVKQYRSPDDLASVVSRGLIRAMKKTPRPGWVRGDQAMTDTVRTQIAELRAALAEAERQQSELAHQRAAASDEIDATFEHGSDEIELVFTVKESSYNGSSYTAPLTYTWDEVVDLIGPSMLDEASEPTLRKVLCGHAHQHLMQDAQWTTLYNPTTTITDDSWGRVLVQLRALGIITAGQKKRTVSDKAVYWRLTPAGDEYLVRLKATKRAEAG